MATSARSVQPGILANARNRLSRWISHQSRPRRGRPDLCINLALQGGGSHGAFTWGVLDRLLEEEQIGYEGISGASAGAMNAVVMASGFLNGGHQGARSALHAFWQSVSQAAHMGPLQPTPLEYLISGWNRDWSPSYLLLRAMAKLASPYQINPTGFNALIPLLEKHVDFEALRTTKKLKLFVAVTNLHSGMLRLLRNHELSPRGLAASACLPLLFHAVELDGEYYWDGGYSANPALSPLLFECRSRDLLMVQLSPLRHEQVPKQISDIIDRAGEISFNAGFLRELQMLAMMQDSAGSGLLNPIRRTLHRLNLHQIHTEGALAEFGKTSRINAEWPFLQYLRDMGRNQADEWLRASGKALGRRSSLDLSQFRVER